MAHSKSYERDSHGRCSPAGILYSPPRTTDPNIQGSIYVDQNNNGTGEFGSRRAPDDYIGGNHYDRADSLQLGYPYQAPEENISTRDLTSGSPKSRLTARFLASGLLRWVISALLSVLYYAVIRLYQDRTLSPNQKSVFDALIVALSIALGLNIAAALNKIALHLRWWFLSKRQIHIREVEIHSMMALMKLLWQSPSPLLQTLCVLWIFLNIAIQVCISALGLTFNEEPGISDIYVDSGLGVIAVPDMSRFARVGRFRDGIGPESFAAHILGDIGSSYNYSMLPVEPLTDQPIAKYPYSFWNATDHWEYVYMNSAPVYGSRDFNFLSVYSNRSVRSSAVCDTPPYTFEANTTAQVVTIQHTKVNRTATFPILAMGVESIYYLTKPVQHTENSTGACGPGCSTVHVFEPKAGPPAEGSSVNATSSFFYYECNATVTSTTLGGTEDPIALPPTRAAIAAQAIALSGQVGDEQYTSYNFGLQFGEAQNNSAAGMADMVSRFAIGVVAAAAQTNPKVVVSGRPPRQGVRLVLDHAVAFAAVLAAASALQLGLVVTAALLVRGVDLPDELLVDREGAARQYIEIGSIKNVRTRE